MKDMETKINNVCVLKYMTDMVVLHLSYVQADGEDNGWSGCRGSLVSPMP